MKSFAGEIVLLRPPAYAGREGGDFLRDVQLHTEFAFQPIVNVHSGTVFGFEALLRGFEKLDFNSVTDLLDYAFDEGLVVELDAILHRKAMRRFREMTAGINARLFLNIDNRLLTMPDFDPGTFAESLRQCGLATSTLCLELSELQTVVDPDRVKALFRNNDDAFTIAVDDFGAGHSGLQLLCQCHPDLIKVDRFFIGGIDVDRKKRVFLSAIVNLAHVLGIPVVAEGVETEAEFRICREIGCELIQGYFIARPSTADDSLLPSYEIVAETNRTNRRERQSSNVQLRPEIDYLEPIARDMPMQKLLQIFRSNRSRSFFPVIDERHYPLGVVHERDIKEFAYSPFGKDLLNNSHSPFKLRAYITPCLSCDVNTPVERVLSAFALQSDTPAILVVEDGRYVGMLHANALIRLMNERNVMLALNENPLTRLPGNISIDDYLVKAFEDEGSSWNLAYFDLDNFKPFNDRFGFRQGDRAILLFAQLLRNEFKNGEIFLGHIGGDDFFAGARNVPTAAFIERIRDLLTKFREDASSFYDAEARRAGFTTVRDREGREMEVPLLSASCAMLALPATPRKLALDAATTLLADLKKHAKKSTEKLALADFS